MARILVSEGCDLVRDFLTFILTEAGHVVLPAGTVEEAVRHHGRGGIDLLVTSLQFPDLSGEDLVRTIWAADQRLPVLVLTSRPTDVSIQNSSHDCRVRVLQKPVALQPLLNVVEALLKDGDSPKKMGA
jgi:two-component system phosphate regulon response regulator PhoB